jgi:hypothetical protein
MGPEQIRKSLTALRLLAATQRVSPEVSARDNRTRYTACSANIESQDGKITHIIDRPMFKDRCSPTRPPQAVRNVSRQRQHAQTRPVCTH